MAEVVGLLLAALPFILLLVAGIVALGKRPGFRRRRSDLQYEGQERRCPLRQLCAHRTSCRISPRECPINRSITLKKL